MARREERWTDLGLLVLRIGFGLALLYFHGWSKLVGGPERWAGVGSAMEHLGIGFGHTVFGFLAAFGEAVGGILIAAGLFFRPVALLVAATMFVAWFMHVATGEGSPAHAFKNLWVALGLALMGPGRYSIDHWWRSRNQPPSIELERDIAE
jgi:putative oxidoreductase